MSVPVFIQKEQADYDESVASYNATATDYNTLLKNGQNAEARASWDEADAYNRALADRDAALATIGDRINQISGKISTDTVTYGDQYAEGVQLVQTADVGGASGDTKEPVTQTKQQSPVPKLGLAALLYYLFFL